METETELKFTDYKNSKRSEVFECEWRITGITAKIVPERYEVKGELRTQEDI